MAPGIPLVIKVQSRSITLKWSKIDCADQNGYLTYIIDYIEGHSTPKEIITGSSSTEYTLTSLIPNTNYSMRVLGVTSAGKGPSSEFSNITLTLEDGR